MSARMFVFAFFLGVTLYVEAYPGYGPTTNANPEEKNLAARFRYKAEIMCDCGLFNDFIAMFVRTEVVKGEKKIMEVYVGGTTAVIAIRIFIPLPGQGPPKLTGTVPMSQDEKLGPELFE